MKFRAMLYSHRNNIELVLVFFYSSDANDKAPIQFLNAISALRLSIRFKWFIQTMP